MGGVCEHMSYLLTNNLTCWLALEEKKKHLFRKETDRYATGELWEKN
jgi:hypothetical protein